MYDVLFAPSRGKYIGEKPKVDCLFCGIRKGEVWTRGIYQDDQIMVIMNIFPYSPGHIQVIPPRHVEDLKELYDGEFEYALDFVQRGVSLVREVMRPDGFNIGINLGKAGASVPHLHFQIVPRYRRTPKIEQEEIHKMYLKNVNVLKRELEIKGREKGCKCLSRYGYVVKKDPFVYLSESPYNRGHVIVSPARHVSDVCELSSSELLRLFKEVVKVKDSVNSIYHPVGMNIGMNFGDVPNSSEHLQIHVVPRYDPESGFMEVIGNTRVVVESLDQTYERIKEALG
ncbi:MAG: HIT domain-containing protein [Methanocellales archaeon]|nr:HIT domain-containing protein [Methanocellales archaeon]